jgi:SWI/SNF-related matrix-associated actin-dependent regulator of chromatin subfamily A containing DEAD/H box 1
MSVMSDFELHGLCAHYKGLDSYELSDKHILDSGKFECMNQLLDQIKTAVKIYLNIIYFIQGSFFYHFILSKGDRVLIFSQYKIMLDIVEKYLHIKKHKFLRLDGSTKVEDRY